MSKLRFIFFLCFVFFCVSIFVDDSSSAQETESGGIRGMGNIIWNSTSQETKDAVTKITDDAIQERIEKQGTAGIKEPESVTCEKSGGIWQNDQCQCDFDKGLTSGQNSLVCEKIKNEENNDTGNTTESVNKSNDTNENKGSTKLENPQDKLASAKEKEQSLANRTLTAASTAATGLGMMQAAEAIAEKRADADAEADMRAYLETLHCSYANQQVKYSPEEIVLPGGNELAKLRAEYIEIADRLKKTKSALKLAPGIESQEILDHSDTGLYDDMSIGKTGGGYASLARALSDPESADAAAWSEQKDATKKKLVGGAIAAGAGIIGGAIGNIAINGKDDASGTDWGTDSDDDEDDDCDENGVCMGEASAGDDDKEDNPTRREQKKKCKKSGGQWQNNSCSCDSSKNLRNDTNVVYMCTCKDSDFIWNEESKGCLRKDIVSKAIGVGLNFTVK